MSFITESITNCAQTIFSFCATPSTCFYRHVVRAEAQPGKFMVRFMSVNWLELRVELLIKMEFVVFWILRCFVDFVQQLVVVVFFDFFLGMVTAHQLYIVLHIIATRFHNRIEDLLSSCVFFQVTHILGEEIELSRYDHCLQCGHSRFNQS